MSEQYQQRDNSGALFVNDKKQSDNHPDYRGKCMVNGKEMQMSAWKKTAASGNKYMSFAFSEPYNPNQQQQPPQNTGQQQSYSNTPQGNNHVMAQGQPSGFDNFQQDPNDPF